MSITIKKNGFTLIELLLVIVIITAMAIGAMRLMQIKTQEMQIDHTSLQIQEIFQAATSYYIDQYNDPKKPPNTGSWPGEGGGPLSTNITILTDAGYLPATALTSGALINAWGNPYLIGPSSATNDKEFVVQTVVPSAALALLLKNKLPLADITDSTTVTAYINVPSYNYNNASAVNQIDYYNPGQCIDNPPCPNGMKPEVLLSAAQVYGFRDDKLGTLPINSFTVYAAAPGTSCAPGDMPSGSAACDTNNQVMACVHVDLSDGSPFQLDSTTAPNINILALKKCVPGDATPAPL